MRIRLRVSGRLVSWVCFAVVLSVSMARLQLEAQTFQTVCPNSASLFTMSPAGRLLDKPWKRDYPILIYNMEGVRAGLDAVQAAQDALTKRADAEAAHQTIKDKEEELTKLTDQAQKAALQTDITSRKTKQAQLNAAADDAEAIQEQKKKARSSSSTHGKLFWKEEGDGVALSPINNPGFVAKVYTTEKVLVLICNAKFGDGSSMSETSVVVTGPDDTGVTPQGAKLAGVQLSSMDRLYVLDATKVTNNSLERVTFSVDTGTGDGPGKGSDTVATVLLERHKIIHFSAGGGILTVNAPSNAYSVISVPTVITTTNTASTTTLTNGVNTGTNSSTTVSTVSGTASYVLSQKQSNQQYSGIAGLTWYPFGHDTYPVTNQHGLTLTQSAYSPKGSFGIFVGTSVSSFGNFTAAPSYEFFPGVQVFAGLTLRSKTTLSQGITACTGYGTGPSFSSAPSSTNTSQTSTTASGTTTTTTTTTITTTSTTSGCSNGDKVSLFSGTTAPTQTATTPAFSFGLVFNTNLIKAFSGFGK